MKVKCMYYAKRYESKPQGVEIASVQKNLSKTEISIEDLAQGLSHGATFKPAYLNGKKTTDWIEQQLFALDFDEGTTIQEELIRCKELNILPCFGYTSFSYTPEHEKFRLVFCADRVITDIESRNKIQLSLMEAFKHCDNKCKDGSRLFFGGRNLIHEDYSATINTDEIIKYYVEEIKPAKVKKALIANSGKVDKVKKECNIVNKSEENIQAIMDRNADKLRGILGLEDLVYTDKKDSYYYQCTPKPYHTTFKCQNDLYNYINSIDLAEYLGVGNEMFNCILPSHEDDSPSAHIYISDNGTPLYKCFGCDKVRTIIGITEELAHCRRSEAIEFIKAVYGLELVESDWTRQQKQLMIDSANYLDTEEFKEEFPELSKLIRTRKHHIQKMLMHFTQYVNEDLHVDGKPLFFGSYNTLMQVCEINPINGRTRFSQSLTLFTLLNMLDKVTVEKIPEKELAKARAIAIKYGHKKLTNFISFEEYGVKSLSNSEEIAKVLKENNVTLKAISREYVLRTFGTELADKVFPQYKFENERGTTEKSDDATTKLAKMVANAIGTDGYILESELKATQKMELQWKKSIQEILNAYGLKRVRLNKQIKADLGITCEGYPFVIAKIS
ncbi:MAG: hypothetical protein EOM50_17900 [Erysipelotrichia bacterium]|nr:hypothetical protein [Erysipelotrichia bacterium]